MRYKNAQNILPDKLLRELQQYISGGMLYVPAAGEKKPWGEASGARSYYKQRNQAIREAYRAGANVPQLAQQYGLTEEAIRKILSA